MCPAGHFAFDPANSLSLFSSPLTLIPLLASPLSFVSLCATYSTPPCLLCIYLPITLLILLCPCPAVVLVCCRPPLPFFPFSFFSPFIPTHIHLAHTSLLVFSIHNKLLHHFYEYHHHSTPLSLSSLSLSLFLTSLLPFTSPLLHSLSINYPFNRHSTPHLFLPSL